MNLIEQVTAKTNSLGTEIDPWGATLYSMTYFSMIYMKAGKLTVSEWNSFTSYLEGFDDNIELLGEIARHETLIDMIIDWRVRVGCHLRVVK